MAHLALPSTTNDARLALEMRMTSRADREDAAQEAWVAHLQGRDTAVAVNTFNKRERRHRARQTTRGLMSHWE